MSALILVNAVPATLATSGEFRILQGSVQVARIGVHSGAMATFPTTNDGPVIIDEGNDSNIPTAQQWAIYAIVNGITTPTVMVTDPNATITLQPDNGESFLLTVS